MVAPTINHQHDSPQGAEITLDVGETKSLHQLSSPHLPWIMGSRGTGAHYQWLSLMSSRCDRSDGSQHSQQGKWHQEDVAHMKINLPVFKDEDAKDAVTY